MVHPHFTVILNIELALIPFAIACGLFLIANHRTILWWLLLLVCFAFLPNSAYTITDIIHFVAALKDPAYTAVYDWFVLFPAYCLYCFITFQFYVLTVFMMQEYLNLHVSKTVGKWFVPFIHILCAIGVYLGRVQRLESTDIIEHPKKVFIDLIADLTHQHSLVVIIGFSALFYSLYFVFNALNQKIKLDHWIKEKMADNR